MIKMEVGKMIKKVLSIALLLILAASVSSFGATKVLNTATSGTSIDHVQVWLSGGAAFNAGSYAPTPTVYALAAASTMKVWVTGNSGTMTGTYNSATVTSYWGTPTVNWQNWIGDKTSNGITTKVAVMEAPSYIHGSQIDYRINFVSDPGIGAIVNIQYYKDGALVEVRKYTKLTAPSSTDIPNATNATWTLDKTPANQGVFNPGFIDKDGNSTPTYVDVANIAALKTKVGQTVRLTGTVTVTCVGSGRFFVGEETYKGCIKVVGADTVTSGGYVKNLIGTVAVDAYGQYTLTLTAPVGAATSGNAIKTVGVSNKSAKTDAKLQTNLVKVWGLVGAGADYTINDGYNDPITVKKGVATEPVGVAAIRGVLWKEAGAAVLYQNYTPAPIPIFTITASAGAGGTITPSGAVVVNQGANQTFTIAAGSGYTIADVFVDSVSQGAIASYTFTNVTADHTISATFAASPTYTITASAGAGGTITPSGAVVVNQGSNKSFTIAASPGYNITDVVVDSVSQGAIASYTFTNVTANHTISATFAVSPTHTITATAGTGGTITPSGAVVVNHGSNQAFAIAAGSGYTIANVVVDSVSQGAIASYTFSNVIIDHTISATFNSTSGPTPIACYEFENNVLDTQGAFNGTAFGTPTYTTGKVGLKAIQFNGSTQYVSIARPISDDWTISFFVKTNQTSPTGTQWYNGNGLVDGEVGGAANDFGVTYLNGKVAFGVGSPDTTIQSTSPINTGGWMHVACTRNSANGQMKVYINGGLQTTGTGPTGARAAPANLHFGNLQTTINYFSGTIDQLKIYNTVLNTTDIVALVAEGGNTTWWTITATGGIGGTLSPSGNVAVAQGDNQTFTITPGANYSIESVIVDGVPMGTIPSYTFSNVSANHTISVTFEGVGLFGVITGPYLQAITPNSAYVLVETNATDPVTIEWGEDDRYGLMSYTESYEPTDSVPTTYVHNVKIPGLQANRLYHYCVNVAGTLGADHTFKTAVNPGTPYRFAMTSDFKGGTTVHDAVSSLIQAANPMFSLYAGDLSNTGVSDTLRREFFRAPELALDANVPFFNSIGNHEGWGVSAKAFTQAPASTSGTQAYYSFDWGDVHFVCVNNYSDGYGVGSTQYNWVAADLAASNKPWKIVWCHNPAYTSTIEGHGGDNNMVAMSVNLFVPNHVDMVLNGHNHFYQHSLVDGIHHMIVGSAGAALYTPTDGPNTVLSAKSYCYAIFNVTATTLNYVAYNDSGNVLETINLTKQFTIAGKVSNSGGTGIYNAVVTAGGPYSNVAPVVTDSSGNYSLTLPGPGTYELYADGSGYNANFSNVSVPTSGTVTSNLTLTSAAEAGVYNGSFETAAGSLPDGWETFIEKPTDGLDYYGNAWPDKPGMYNFSRSTAGNTTPGGTASALLGTATGGALTDYGILRWERFRVSGDACTGITETTLVDTARAWTTNYWYAGGTGYVQIVHGGNDSGAVPTMAGDFKVLSNDATTLTVAAGSNLATLGYAAGDHYRFVTEVRNYWYTGGIRTTAARRIPVDRTKVYNFYLKQKTTYSGSESEKCHLCALIWRDSLGVEVGRSEWRWQPSTTFTQSAPRLFLAPPMGAATVEVCVYTRCTDNANKNWVDTSYIDDVVIDPVPVTATSSIQSLADGTHVVVPGDFTSLAPRDISGERYTNYYYVSEPDGSAGIRIQNAAPKMDNLNVNEMVAVSGAVRSIASTGEKYIQANVTGTSVVGGGATPSTMTVASVLTDPNAMGKFVSITAQISSIASDVSSFNITDAGSTIKVNSVGFPLLASFASVGNTIKVNGVVSKEGSTRVILMMNYTKQTTAWPDNDVTWFSISDTHYGSGWATRLLHKERIAAMNALPGTAYPSGIAGTVGECRGVTVSGDITDNDNDKAAQFAEFAMDFGLSGQNQLRYPAYEGTGNHDGGLTFATAEGIIRRNPIRPNVIGIGGDGWDYSWDWGKVHCIGSNEIGSYLRRESLDWIAADLAANVGTSGRPVVIIAHEGFDSFSFAFSSRGEAKRLYDVIKNYNVIAIIWGHTGGYAQYKWGGIDVFGVDGPMEWFHVFHVTPTELIVTRRQWSTNNWNSWTFRKNITGM
ncbi:MAG: metallophosphoesterase [Armatimonadetes bacterium]|nr:metallophosphoesterase [Armatimonadota bacterium]